MIFKKYSEIENVQNLKYLKKIQEFGIDNPTIKYVVETKIDGSNFQCSIDENDNFKIGSRNNLLDLNQNFQGCNNVIGDYDIPNKLKELKKLFFNDFLKSVVESEYKFSITVYGELCGGMYRHPNIEKVKGTNKIQGRIDYSPKNEWIPFDIVVRNEDGSIIHFFTQEEVYDYCKAVNLPVLPIRFKGSLEECLKYPNDFIDDTGHILFDLPLIENNITEGVVIKPNVYLAFPNGERIIIKNKNEKFKERTCKNKAPKEDKVLSDLENKWLNIMSEYITESRLYSVMSKIEIKNDKQFGMVLGEYMKDLIKDFEKDYGDEVSKLESELQDQDFRMSLVRKQISKMIIETIRPIFLEKLTEA